MRPALAPAPSSASAQIPVVSAGRLLGEARAAAPIDVDSPVWFAWLDADGHTTFRFEAGTDVLTVRREQRGGQMYWYAYRKSGGRLRKAYAGRSFELDLDRLHSAAIRLGDEGGPRVRSQALPAQPGPLIGREQELARLSTELRNPHELLVTLIGPRGVGKTRLAVAVADAVKADFAGRVTVVDLAPLSEPVLVTPAIAQALGVRAGQRSTPDAIRVPLTGVSHLLVLDNFEHDMIGHRCVWTSRRSRAGSSEPGPLSGRRRSSARARPRGTCRSSVRSPLPGRPWPPSAAWEKGSLALGNAKWRPWSRAVTPIARLRKPSCCQHAPSSGTSRTAWRG